jgi:RNA polymerase sigma factor (sigma-70 family)
MKKSVHYLYQGHYQWLWLWLFKKIKNKQSAEDLVQDTFVTLIEKQLQLQEIQDQRAFLLTIAKRKLFNFWRRQDFENSYLQSLKEVGINQESIPTEQLCLVQDALNIIDRLLDGLPPTIQHAFLLKKLEQFTHPEIAKIMNISLATVERYIKQATIHCVLQRKNMSND